MHAPPGPPPDHQLLRLAVQNLACSPQAQRRYVQMGWMPRALSNLDHIGANVDVLVGEGRLNAKPAAMIKQLRDQVKEAQARQEDFIEEKASGPREFLFGHALENDDWEAIRQHARRIHTEIMGEESVFIAIQAK